MRVIDAIPQSKTANELPPEELAAVLLQCLNSQAAASNRDPTQFHIGNTCNGESSNYEQAGQKPCNFALAAAWMHLVSTGMIALNPKSLNDWYLITRRGQLIKTKADYEHFKAASLFPQGALHPEIERAAYQEFLRGDYEAAVFKAFKAIEVITRRAIGAGNEVYGKDLMVKAFSAENGVLTDDEELPAERQALMQLFTGAIGRFKNPPSHREVNYSDPKEVIEAIQFASLLMRIVWTREIDQLGFPSSDEKP